MLRKNGYTLVEILIVVMIVGLLASLAVPGYLQHTQRARVAEAVATMSMIRQSLRDFNINNATYYDVTAGTGEIYNNLPCGAGCVSAAGVPTPADAGVGVDVGIAQYFSNESFSVDAIDHASTRFTNPGPVDFVITASGCDSDDVCTTPVAPETPDCALNTDPVETFRLEMDNTGRVFVSYDYNCGASTGNWTAY